MTLSFPKPDDIKYDFMMEFHDALPFGMDITSSLEGPYDDSVAHHNWGGRAYVVFISTDSFGPASVSKVYIRMDRDNHENWYSRQPLNYNPREAYIESDPHQAAIEHAAEFNTH